MSLKWLAQIYMDQSDPPQPYVFANILKSFFFFVLNVYTYLIIS